MIAIRNWSFINFPAASEIFLPYTKCTPGLWQSSNLLSSFLSCSKRDVPEEKKHFLHLSSFFLFPPFCLFSCWQLCGNPAGCTICCSHSRSLGLSPRPRRRQHRGRLSWPRVGVEQHGRRWVLSTLSYQTGGAQLPAHLDEAVGGPLVSGLQGFSRSWIEFKWRVEGWEGSSLVAEWIAWWIPTVKSDSQLNPSILVVLSDRARGDCDKDTRLFEKKKTFPLNLRNVHFCLRQVTALTEQHLPESKVTLAAQSWIILCQCPFPHWVDSSWNHLQIMLIVHPHTYQIINIIFQSISKDNIESNVILVFHLMFCILFWEHGMGNQTVSDSAFCWMVWIQDGVFMWEGPTFAFIVAASKSSARSLMFVVCYYVYFSDVRLVWKKCVHFLPISRPPADPCLDLLSLFCVRGGFLNFTLTLLCLLNFQ